MPAFTTNQWIVVALVLVLGWLLGLLSRQGGARWRREYEVERDAHASLRHSNDERIAAANARIAELETAAPVGVGAGGGIAAAAAGRRDDLALIRGVGRSGETRLNDAGIHRYRDISRLTPADEAALEGRLGFEPGQIASERWREQADLLQAGRIEDHTRTFG